MYFTRVVMIVAWAPLLSGCMAMGGMGHGGSKPGMHGMALAGRGGSEPVVASTQRLEAGNEGGDIVLSVANPTRGAAVAIEARLGEERGRSAPADQNVWLRVHAPDGSVDRVPMRHLGGGTHRAEYRFRMAGPHQLTAEARVGMGLDARTVSATTVVGVDRNAHGPGQGWITPAALLGGLGMVAMMVFMLNGSVH